MPDDANHFEKIRDELAAMYRNEQSTQETEQKLSRAVPPEAFAQFVVSAFNRSWISTFNLGLDDEGQVM